MSGLVERVECLVADEKSILDMFEEEDFKKKNKYLLKEVKNEIKTKKTILIYLCIKQNKSLRNMRLK